MYIYVKSCQNKLTNHILSNLSSATVIWVVSVVGMLSFSGGSASVILAWLDHYSILHYLINGEHCGHMSLLYRCPSDIYIHTYRQTGKQWALECLNNVPVWRWSCRGRAVSGGCPVPVTSCNHVIVYGIYNDRPQLWPNCEFLNILSFQILGHFHWKPQKFVCHSCITQCTVNVKKQKCQHVCYNYHTTLYMPVIKTCYWYWTCIFYICKIGP